MKIQCIEKRVLSTDMTHHLAGTIMLPEGKPKGLFHIVHGMQEYMGRYKYFMERMAQAGYIVFGFDNLGHGYTVNDRSELGFIASKNGWKYLVDDVAIFANSMKLQYGEYLPYYLFGHSMGSFIARLTAEKYDMQDKLIIMGTGGPIPGTTPAISLLKKVKRAKGERYVSKNINDLIFGTYNRRFGYDDPYNWISTLKETRTAFANDPLCNYSFSVSALEDLLRLSRECNKSRWFSSRVRKKPILLLSGENDPVGDYGMGVKKVHDRLKSKGADIKFVLFRGCRHEPLNDISREKAIDTILDFLNT